MKKRVVLISSIVSILVVSALVVVLVVYLPKSGEIRYQLTFESTWSETTHPYDFPPNPHFSGLIGSTHSENVTFWEFGGFATEGIKNVAETGSKTSFITEIEAAIDDFSAYSLISGSGISISPGSVSVKFSITKDFSFVTVVSMIAPSPDWFVGINTLNLLDGNGRWLDEISIILYLYDAGTDSGITYLAPNNATSPQDPISAITPTEFPGSDIAYGTFTFTKL
jgi:hypothetical protein